jgi:hypothetical protein
MNTFFIDLIDNYESFKSNIKKVSLKEFEQISYLSKNNEYVKNLLQASFYLYVNKALSDKDIDFLYNYFILLSLCNMKISSDLLFDWLYTSMDDFVPIKGKKITKHNITYQFAMLCLALCQQKDNFQINYWIVMWEGGPSFYHNVAYFGLQCQNADIACKQLPVLIRRSKHKAGLTLRSMWKNNRGDTNLSAKVISSIKSGMRHNHDWAFAAYLYLKETLSEDLKRELDREIGVL